MNEWPIRFDPRRVLVALWLCAGAGAALCAAADDKASGDSIDGLRATLNVVQSLNDPKHPVWLRFALHNPSDRPVEIPLTQPLKPDNGIALPRELVTGPPDSPWLSIAYEDERPVEIRANAAAESSGDEGNRVLRLAPHGSVGAVVDLLELHKQVRYQGRYRLDWRPFGGRLPTASARLRVEPRRDAVLVTDYGKVTFELLYEKAPRNVGNFLELVRDGFYDGKTFHRIIPGFLIQGGCPLGNGNGIRADGKLIAAEFHDVAIDIGTLVMARKPDDPNSASCQFFVALARLAELDGKYTVVGQARDDESLRTLLQISRLPTDRSDRPMRVVLIRSINLVDPALETTGRHELSRP